MSIGKRIIEFAIENGATLVGIVSMEAVKTSASHTMYNKVMNSAGANIVRDDKGGLPDDEVVTDGENHQDKRLFTWPDTVRSVLVIGLSHPEDKPELDWWDGRGTLGNRILIDIIKQTSRQIENRLKLKTHKLHYYVEKGGIFLKDAAVLAGFGCIGKNNLLITTSHGPRIRLRALFLDAEISPTGPVAFDPCSNCNFLCRSICPEKASAFKPFEFSKRLPGRDGAYNRDLCNLRMEKDVAENTKNNYGNRSTIKFCRKCEFICPVGKKRQGNIG